MVASFDHSFAPAVLAWIAALTRMHDEQRAFLDDLAAQVRLRSDTTLHYGALGLRGQVEQEREAGNCSKSFAARADAVLWALEVLASDDARFHLPAEAVAAVVDTALACGEPELEQIAQAIDVAERVRWREWADARKLLAAARPVAWRPALARLEQLVP